MTPHDKADSSISNASKILNENVNILNELRIFELNSKILDFEKENKALKKTLDDCYIKYNEEMNNVLLLINNSINIINKMQNNPKLLKSIKHLNNAKLLISDFYDENITYFE